MITTVKNSAQLLKALKTANSGDTILLASGTYDAVSISGLNFPTGVTIESADPTHEAVLSNLVVTNSSGLNFQQVGLSTTNGTAVTVSGSQNITFSGDTFSGSASALGNAMMLRTSSNITVTGSNFGSFGTGINVLTDSNLTITNNTFHGITGGAIRGTGVTASKITGNTFTDASAKVPTHQDVLYLWQDNTANNVTINNNTYGPPLPAVLTTATQLLQALENAHAGDVIKLAAGTYDSVALDSFQFTTAVTITSADPAHQAVLSNLSVTNSSGLTFQGVTLSTTTGTAVGVGASHAITFSGDTFTGPAAGKGNAMTVTNSDTITITGSDIGKFGTGINVVTDSNLTITNNTFHDITGGDVRGTAVTNSNISGNAFTNASSSVANHQDVVYLWQDNAANNVTVSNNTYGSGAPATAPPPPPPPPPTSTSGTTTTTAPTLTNAQLLVQDLQNAHAGDVIKLAAGTYDGAVLSGLHFASGVTITSADPTHEAVISNLTVSNSSGMIFEGVTLSTGSGTAVTVTGSQSIGFAQDAFSGSGAGTALAVSSSSGVTVSGSDVGNFATGLNLQTDSNVAVTGNNFHGNSSGAIVGAAVTSSVISANSFPDASTANTAHTDVINLAQDNTANQVQIYGNAFGSAHVVTVSNAQQLLSALGSAHAGDVIELAAGTYSSLTLSGFNFTSPVTITSADPNNHAVLTDLTAVYDSGITFADLTLSTASGTAATLGADSNIVFSHDAFSGSGGAAGNAVVLTNSSAVTIANSDFANIGSGISITSDANLSITGNTFHGDIGVRGSYVTNSSITGNSFPDADPTNATHADVIALWQDNTANHVTISGNTFPAAPTTTTTSTTTSSSTTTSTVSSTTPITTSSTTTTTSSGIVDLGHNTVEVSNADDLWTAVHYATAGETILVAAGNYSNVQISGMLTSGTVHITSADANNEATITGLNVSGSNLVIDHLKVMAADANSTAISVGNASNVSLDHLTISGGPAGTYDGLGMLVEGVNGVTITNSDLGNLGSGTSFVNSNGITFSNNSMHDIGTDGMVNAGVTNEVISGNSYTSFNPPDGAHPDAIQFFANGATRNNNIIIEDNVITRGSATSAENQGIFIADTDHIQIVGNAMDGTMYNGISVSDDNHVLINNNYVQGFTDMTSWIMTRGASSYVTVTNNHSTNIVTYNDAGSPNPNYVESGNTVLAAANVGDYSAMNAWLAQHAPTGASFSDPFFLT